MFQLRKKHRSKNVKKGRNSQVFRAPQTICEPVAEKARAPAMKSVSKKQKAIITQKKTVTRRQVTPADVVKDLEGKGKRK
jgi:hypothetical protein